MKQISAVALEGIGEVTAGDDLAALVAEAAARTGLALDATDVVVVASKVVAKAEGRLVAAPDAAARAAAIAAESLHLVAERTLPDGRTTRVVQSRSGPVLAAAGVDASDVPAGTVLLLPADPDASAARLRERLGALTGVRPGVLVTDTGGRPWRQGVTDIAIGAAGVRALDDVRGRLDTHGRPMEVTVRAVADEIAGLGDLVKGKAAATPVALVRGLAEFVVGDNGDGGDVGHDGGEAVSGAELVRVGPTDWFAHGHVEAVREALGVDAGAVTAPSVLPEDHATRLARAVAIATAGRGSLAGARIDLGTADRTPAGTPADARELRVVADPFAAGVLTERLLTALWSQGLSATAAPNPTGASVTLSPPSP